MRGDNDLIKGRYAMFVSSRVSRVVARGALVAGAVATSALLLSACNDKAESGTGGTMMQSPSPVMSDGSMMDHKMGDGMDDKMGDGKATPGMSDGSMTDHKMGDGMDHKMGDDKMKDGDK